MATWLPHIKLSFGGTMGFSSLDAWVNTVNFKMSSDDAGTVGSEEIDSDDLDGALEALETPLKAWYQSGDAQISNYCKLEWAKLNFILANGKQRDVNTHRRDFTAVSGGNSQPPPHWFVSFALTLRTDFARGRAHSGRIYPPMVGALNVAGTPYISALLADGMASAGATMLNAVSTAMGGEFGPIDVVTPVYPVVASPIPTLIGSTGGALLQRITGVVVDRVADVQHRRTEQVPRSEGARSVVTGQL